MFQAVLLPILIAQNFSLLAIATPGAEHNHYSRLLELTKPDGSSLFKTIRIALTCPPCIAAGRTDMCEHRADLVPSWHSSGRRDIIKRVLEGDTDLFRRESLGVITTSAEYFLKRDWVAALNQDIARPNFASAKPRLLFMAVDPGGGGASSSYALCTVALRPDETAVVVGLDQSGSSSSREIQELVVRHALRLRKHPVYRGAALVIIIEANMGWIGADLVVNWLTEHEELKPLVVVSHDPAAKHGRPGRAGVITTEANKVAYIEAVRALVEHGHLSWAADECFVSERPKQLREELSNQMVNYRRERKAPSEEGWQNAKVKIFGKAHGQQDDLMMALQMAIYWGRYELNSNPHFREACGRQGWL